MKTTTRSLMGFVSRVCQAADGRCSKNENQNRSNFIHGLKLLFAFSLLMSFSISMMAQNSSVHRINTSRNTGELPVMINADRVDPSSQSPSGSLGVIPCSVSGTSTLCQGGSSIYSGPQGAGYTYVWTIANNNSGAAINGSSTAQTVTVDAGLTPGNFDLQLTVTSGGISSTCKLTITVIAGATCSIIPTSDVCPGSTDSYTAPSGMDSYLWIVSGSGTISGTNSAQSVSVVAGMVCNGSYTLNLVFFKSGCSFTCSQVISVIDNSAPAITLPGPNATIACTSTPVFTPPTASDFCDPNPSIVLVSTVTIPGHCANSYSIKRTWKAVDACGNESGTVSQTINVVDNAGPVIASAGSNMTIYCPAVPQFTPPTAIDNCDPNPSIIKLSDITTHGACAGSYTRTITWKAEDACGNNSVHRSQTITVIDTLPPALSCPADLELECGSPTDTGHTGVAYANDICSELASVTYADVATPANCTGYAGIDRTWTATDGCGNSSTCVQHITFIDHTAPTITCPADVNLECGASTDPEFTGSATATDNCNSNIAINYTDAATPVNCTGYAGIDRTWTATDGCQNTSSCVQHIVFVDHTAPTITCPADVNLECGASTDPEFTGSATATDNCNSLIDISHTDVATTNCTGNPGVDRTWTATDGCQNTSSCV
ncbi:MAG: hypothetical protein NT126_04440, partial [Bacteroidetes bacterium]|nr:hypothetical protein [Bacteroidota bacterium]